MQWFDFIVLIWHAYKYDPMPVINNDAGLTAQGIDTISRHDYTGIGGDY